VLYHNWQRGDDDKDGFTVNGDGSFTDVTATGASRPAVFGFDRPFQLR
jgi:hypothetical protein